MFLAELGKFIGKTTLKILKRIDVSCWKNISKLLDALIPAALEVLCEHTIQYDPDTCTMEEINSVYDKHNIQKPEGIPDTKSSRGNALLNVATAILQKQSPKINNTFARTAIQIAFLIIKGKTEK